MPDILILLVEDSPQDVELTLDVLQGEKLANEICVVRDGEEALDFLFYRGSYAGRTNGPPRLILLDLKLPKVDGLEVLRVIKSDLRTKAIPVVVMTSSKEEQDMVRATTWAQTATSRSRWTSTSSVPRLKNWDSIGCW